MQSFFIYLRPSKRQNAKKSDGVWYAWYRDPETGAKLDCNRMNVDTLNHRLYGGLRSHITSKTEAYRIAQEALNRGKVFGYHHEQKKPVIPRLIEYVESYWDYDNSAYVKRKLVEGSKITRAYVKNMAQAFGKHCKPYLGPELPLDGFKITMMDKIKARLFDAGLSSSTINRVVECLKVPMMEAYKQELIEENIGERLRAVKNTDREKGIMTPDEASRLIAYLKESTTPETYDRWRYLTTALTYYSGMRNSEVMALKASCIEIKNEELSFIHVLHAFSRTDGLKCPKNGKERTVTVPSALARELLSYAESNDSGLIFYSLSNREKPIGEKLIMQNFRGAMEAIGVSKEEQKTRNISFYSLRHFFNTSMVNSGLSEVQIRTVTGHSDIAMTMHYNHETEANLMKQAEARSRVLPYID